MENYIHLHSRIMSLPRSTKRLIMMLADSFALVFALWSAFSLRYADFWPQSHLSDSWALFIVIPVIGLAVFEKLGLYRVVVRYMTVKFMQSVAIGVFLLVGALYVIPSIASVVLFGDSLIPRSIPLIFGLSAWLYLGGSRMVIRSYYYWLVSSISRDNRTIVYGANQFGAQLVSSLQVSRELNVLGFVDDDPKLTSNTVLGLRVYSSDQLEDLVVDQRIDLVLLALTNTTHEQRRVTLERLAQLPVRVKTMPSMTDLIEGKIPDQLRQIEINDLLDRETVAPNERLLSIAIRGKSVCITGAGGSIGAELARQALDCGASTLILFDVSEFALYSIEQELRSRALEKSSNVLIVPLLGSVQDESRLESVFKLFTVHTVLHAAAYKHVPLVEQNVLQGLANNTFGTYKAALAAQRVGVQRFILISTDKAVRPTNVMGATKRLAELCVQNIAEKRANGTVFSMVRFGNVLGSSGSVVPLFHDQIQKGGPVTVTHPDINRYFMTISEAASLVIQAGAMARGGEVFVLDMGDPVKITKLAESMIHLSGLQVKTHDNPTGDIELLYTGLRPGEKLYEELLIGDSVVSTPHEKIMCSQELTLDNKFLHELLYDAEQAIKNNDTDMGRETLKRAVEEFSPTSDNIDWLRISESESSDKLH